MEGAIEAAKAELKASLRNALLQTLQPNGVSPEPNQTNDLPTGSNLSHAQIASYLKQSGFHFALSVFLAESGLTSKNPNITLDPRNLMITAKDESKRKKRELEEVIVSIWERFEKFYSEKFDKEIALWEQVQKERIRALEAQLQSKVKESQRQAKTQMDRQRSKLKSEESQMKVEMSRQKARQEEEQQMQREDLLDQLRQIEVARFELKNLEETFMRFQENEKAKLRLRAEQVQMMEIQAKKNEIEFSQRIEAAVANALELERQKINERIRVMSDRETQAQETIKELKSNIARAYEVESALQDAETRVKDCENALNMANAEVSKLRFRNEAYQERLRKCADYEALLDEQKSLKHEVETLRAQLSNQKSKANVDRTALLAQLTGLRQQVSDQSDLPNERLSLVKDFEQQRHLHEREIQGWKFKEAEFNGKIEAERAKYAELMKLFEQQGESVKEFSKELLQLRSALSVDQKSRKTKTEAVKSADSSASYSSTHDSTPEFVKDARNRMRQLELEAESFEATYKLYRTAMPISTVAMAPLPNFIAPSVTFESSGGKQMKPKKLVDQFNKQSDRERRVSFDQQRRQESTPTPSSSEREEISKKKFVKKTEESTTIATSSKMTEQVAKGGKTVKQVEPPVICQTNQTPLKPVKSEAIQIDKQAESSEPPVDPVLQSYIAAVSSAKPNADAVVKEIVEDVVEVASIDKQSSSEYEW